MLDEAGLVVGPSSIHALIGGSGSGKTTLARAVAGLIRVQSGSIRVDGVPVDDDHATGDKSVQMVFQDPGPAFSGVGDNR